MNTETKTAIQNIAVITDYDDIKLIQEALTSRSKAIQSKMKNDFKVGDKVSFTGRGGVTLTGTVQRIMQKNISVNTSQGMWRVSPALLTKA